jgi:HemY protein
MPIPRLKTNNPEQLEKVLRQQIKTVGDRPLLWSTLGQSLMRTANGRRPASPSAPR